jgi:thiamine-phosphate pyrophosphorylase
VHPQILRTIDANINRVSEGLRVLEDISRFICEDADISRELKAVRHRVNQLVSNINSSLLETRDSAGDIGSDSDLPHDHKDLFSIVKANAKRVQEGIRVIEELAKLPELKSALPADELRKSRFQVYTLEKQLVSVLKAGEFRERKDK